MPFCEKCGRELPEAARFCPGCGAPTGGSQPTTGTREKSCPRCGAIMHAGFMVERDSPLSIWTYGSGVYWTPGEAGMMGERVGIKAYACPQCGYIEQYIRYLERDKNTVLSAPTTFGE